MDSAPDLQPQQYEEQQAEQDCERRPRRLYTWPLCGTPQMMCFTVYRNALSVGKSATINEKALTKLSL
jgi:hypothetical protein